VRIAARGLGGSCDYGGYTVGEKMLIIGGMHGGPMRVSGCSRTAPVSRAAADLAELRRMVKQGTATISGTVRVDGGTPRGNIEVRVAGTTRVTRTDATGRYHFELPSGRYTVTPTGDPLLVPRKGIPIDVVAGACVTHDITERWNGRIRGTVRDRNGQPMAGVLVQGLPTSATPPSAWEDPNPWSPSTRSDAHGAYELGPFAPDTYRVSVGVPFSPREPYPPTVAPDVKLGPGAVAGGVDLVVPPPLPTHTITARVTLTGPGGPRDVEVVAAERTSGREYKRYGPPAGFTFIAVAGETVELRACIGDVGCVRRTVQVDRDRVVDLPIETHAITVRAVGSNPAVKWDWWRVETTMSGHSELSGHPRNEARKIIGIAGNTADLHACVLEPVYRQTELGCTTTSVRFDRDRVIDLSIPVTP
jgi:Carboxypeptidase regulatory-like domain